jgi:hypothetical protein
VLLLCGVITSHCSCFVVVLQLRVGVVAPHWWYCFVMVLQIRIGAIIPCYYFALTLLLFPWFKWYPPLPCASGSLELIVPNFWQSSMWSFFIFYLRIFSSLFFNFFSFFSLFLCLISYFFLFCCFYFVVFSYFAYSYYNIPLHFL